MPREFKNSSFRFSKSLAGQAETGRSHFEHVYKLLWTLGEYVGIVENPIAAAVSLSYDFMEEMRVGILPSSEEERLLQ